MNSDLAVKINRRRLLTSLAAGAALTSFPSLISGAGAAPGSVFHFASPGDAVIVTSGGLVETDLGLFSASIESRVGEMARRLYQALLKREVQSQIARARSRLFALGSVTLSGAGNKLILDFQTTLDRQAEFVADTFGAWATDDLPIFIATSIDEEDHEMLGAVLDVIAHITCASGFWRDAKIIRSSEVFCVAQTPRYQPGMHPGTLDLIALWPLESAHD
jgi:hypothetical protein